MVGWHERHPELFHRSNWGVGPRRGLMPLLQTYSNGSGGIGVILPFANDGIRCLCTARCCHSTLCWSNQPTNQHSVCALCICLPGLQLACLQWRPLVLSWTLGTPALYKSTRGRCAT